MNGPPVLDGAVPVASAREAATGLRVVSYGGGVQSTALLVLAAQGIIDFKTFLMANVGDDSENPSTLAYVRDWAQPFAETHGINLHVLNRIKRDGTTETLYGRMTRPGSNACPIPVRLGNGAPASRTCTVDFKIRVTGRWLKDHGASATNPATVALGISVDEIHRANPKRAEPYETLTWPLIDLRMRRGDCGRIIADAGLPIPPKSACWMCPYRRLTGWRDMSIDEPDLFARACDLDEMLRARSIVRGHGPVWISPALVPLRDSIMAGEQRLFDDECGGWCGL